MMAHYQNTERLQGLLKKHQSKNSPTSHWFLYFQGWNLEGAALQWLAKPSSWIHTAHHWKSKIADLYTITLTPRHQFYTLQWSGIQYFLLLRPADNKKTEEVLLTGFPHEPWSPPLLFVTRQTCSFQHHRGRVNRIIEAVKQLHRQA